MNKPLSFAQLDSQRSMLDEREILSDFQLIVENIIESTRNDKGVLVKEAANEVALRLSGASGEVSDGMFIWKDEVGTYHWIARYSNNFRDDDNPSEIISSKSHKAFAGLVKEGIVPAPELWFWHEPDWKIGKANWVSFEEDTGFAIAGGTIDPQFSEMADVLKSGAFKVSHGMPRWSLERDGEDPSVIVSHLTVEISPLPAWAAANKHTDFIIDDKETEMAFTQEEKARLAQAHGVSETLLDRISAMNALSKQAAEEEGRDTKEASDTEEQEEQEETKEQTSGTEEQEGESEDKASGNELIALAVQTAQSVLALNERIDSLTKEVAALRLSDEQKVAAKASTTPLASLSQLLASSVIGTKEAQVDGRTSLARSGPEETAAEPKGGSRTGISFVDAWTS